MSNDDNDPPTAPRSKAEHAAQRLFGAEQPKDDRTIEDFNAEIRERGARHIRQGQRPRNRPGY